MSPHSESGASTGSVYSGTVSSTTPLQPRDSQSRKQNTKSRYTVKGPFIMPRASIPKKPMKSGISQPGTATRALLSSTTAMIRTATLPFPGSSSQTKSVGPKEEKMGLLEDPTPWDSDNPSPPKCKKGKLFSFRKRGRAT